MGLKSRAKKTLPSVTRAETLRPLCLVGYSSGQRGETVNLLAYAFSGSNPDPTTNFPLPEVLRDAENPAKPNGMEEVGGLFVTNPINSQLERDFSPVFGHQTFRRRS